MVAEEEAGAEVVPTFLDLVLYHLCSSSSLLIITLSLSASSSSSSSLLLLLVLLLFGIDSFRFAHVELSRLIV